jgi:hypothetical protein
MTTAKTKTVPFITGFCSHPVGHERCPKVVTGIDCCCLCHTNPPQAGEPPVEVTQPREETTVDAVPALGDSPDLGDSLTALLTGVSGIDAALLDFDGNNLEVLDLLGTVREARKRLAGIESLVENKAVKLMTDNIMEWPGGVAERRFGKDRKEWDHDGLSRAVIQAIVPGLATDRFTGELDTDLSALLVDGIGQYAATNRPSWRVTAVKPLGIDSDEYCHAVKGRATVEVHLKRSQDES